MSTQWVKDEFNTVETQREPNSAEKHPKRKGIANFSRHQRLS
jgi:hypothetical protein